MEDDALTLVSLARVNHEPIVVFGLNRTELLKFSVVASVFWVPVAEIVMVIAGKWMYGVPLGLFAAGGTVVILGVSLQKVKRRRPEGYYQLWLRLQLERFRLTSTEFIRRAGVWDTARHQINDRK